MADLTKETVSIAEGNRRLLKVARALRESKNPDDFTMELYGHGCGSPACALGHYAARVDLQDEFVLGKTVSGHAYTLLFFASNGQRVFLDGTEVCDHFAINSDEAEELFDANGCQEAENATDAAGYIEDFVTRRDARSASNE